MDILFSQFLYHLTLEVENKTFKTDPFITNHALKTHSQIK